MRRTVAVVLLAVLVLTGCGSSKKSSGTRLAGVKTFTGLTHNHKLGHLSYPQTPPVGGDHSPAWLKCGVYSAPVPNENAVHSMEHGAVWLTYQPDLPQVDVDTVDELAKLNPDYVLVSPFAGQPAKVMATAWGLQYSASSAQDPELAQFVKAYAGGGQGGEGGADCARRGLTPAQAQELLDNPPKG
jgi:hypothetical protein